MLISMVGALSAWLARDLDCIWIFIATGLMITALIVTGYFLSLRDQPKTFGMTTEVAALAVFLQGGAALLGYRELAVTLAIVTSVLLAYKRPLHGFVERIGKEDITAGLKLLFATFIILSVMPNRTIDPWGALNPYLIWWLVILIATLSLVGYLACRWMGTERGTALTGFFGGIVSSTAVALSFARRSREDTVTPGIADDLAAGVLISWVIMCVRIVVVSSVMYQPIMGAISIPMAAMAVPALALAIVYYRRGHQAATASGASELQLHNPFSLRSAVKFALLFAAVMLLVKVAQAHLPGRGLYVVAALAGLTDVDAIALSLAQYAGEDGSHLNLAVVAITIAAVANTLVKYGLVAGLGTPQVARRVLVATLAVIAGAVIGVANLAGRI
jgi:uncharacterized membrane protein (DUF4010 family)